MDLHNLKPAKGSVRSEKRIARGEGAGTGGTATRGHKGAKSRSGYKAKKGFEGGQMPLQRRVPKRGFKNINRKEYKTYNLDELQQIAESHSVSTISVDWMVEQKLVRKSDLVKILGRGELSTKLDISAHAFSASAAKAIEAQGGSATTL
jgi:large subunit ribosomal protein L15